MQPEHYDELSLKIGMALSVTKISDDDDSIMVSSDHPILQLINLSRLKKSKLIEEYDRSQLNETWAEVDYVNRSYTAYKEVQGLVDYTDMLISFAEKAVFHCPRFKLCFMDEAQDLSPVQWDIAHALDDLSDRMYCAGDDDQAIYRCEIALNGQNWCRKALVVTRYICPQQHLAERTLLHPRRVA